MDFKKSLSAFGTDAFEDAFQVDLSENFGDLNCIDHMCTNGGMPEDLDDVKINDVDGEGSEIIVNARICFMESAPTSCGDLNREFNHSAVIEIRVDKSSGFTTAEFIESGYSSDEDEDDDVEEFDPGLD